MLKRLEADYASDHPQVRFAHALNGNSSALGAVYIGSADLALMDRPPSYLELDGYQQAIAKQKPFQQAVMRGGASVAGHSSPVVVVVNRRNPLESVSVAQLGAVFQGSGARSVWRALGVAGAWPKRPVSLYGFGVDTDEATLFRTALMGGRRSWNCGFREVKGVNGAEVAKRIGERVAADESALAFSTLDAQVPGTKVLALRTDDGVEVRATTEGISTGRYPLSRTVLALTRADADGAPETLVRSFLAYLVSPRAAAVIAADGEYVPVANGERQAQR